MCKDPQDNSLNSLNSFDDFEDWAEAQWDIWPDVTGENGARPSDLLLGLNYETYQFDYVIGNFSFFRWKLNLKEESD